MTHYPVKNDVILTFGLWEMNIILLGGTVSKRLQVTNDLKVRIILPKNKIICLSRILEFYNLIQKVQILVRGQLSLRTDRFWSVDP